MRRDWDRRGARAPRFSRLRAALTILERSKDGHHVVAYDPSERDSDTSPRRAQRRSPRGRDEPRVTRGRRLVREGEEDLDEVVRTSRRRAMKTGQLSEGEGDKIQIEVGAVKGLESKRGVKRGAMWIIGLSLLLFWVPVIGPATAGYVGGRKAGTPLRAFIAAMVPIFSAFVFLAAVAASTGAVPALVRHFVESGYTAVLGSTPADIPLIGYVLGAMASAMRAGPDALFLLVAFALAGGAISEMKIQERMVPPITARVPASRVAQPMVQSPGRAISGRGASEVDGLVVKLNDALAAAEKERRYYEKARGSAPSAGAWGRPRFGLFGRGRGAATHVPLSASEGEAPVGGLDPAGRKVVAQMLASTPPARGERRPKGLKAPEIDLDLPKTIAYATAPRAVDVEGKGAAHQYRSGKYYHIYGGSVNPVARAKLEKRLRRTHTLHAMRRGARSFAQMVEVDSGGAHGAHPVHLHEESDLGRPRSLESSALTEELHYDALEHLENAKFASPKAAHAAPKHKVADSDDLGGLIAHLGEGGEAVVDNAAVEDVAFGGGPVFDRRGRQRARIAPDEEVDRSGLPPVPKAMAAAMAPPIVHEVTKAPERPRAKAEPAADEGVKVARSANRASLSPLQDAKVNRWLKRAVETAEAQTAAPKAKPKAAPAAHEDAPAPEPEAPVKHESAAKPAAPRKHKEKETAPAFEITHGSTEVDSEAAADSEESSSPKLHKSAREILKEIQAQKKADKDAEAGEAIARSAKNAKAEADEIERHAKEGASMEAAGEVALAAEEKPHEAAPKVQTKRRSRGDELEEVKTDSERLGSDLELTLSPIRDEVVEIREISEVHAEAAPAPNAAASASAAIPMVGEGESNVEVTEVVTTASAPNPPDPERDVQPGEVVLAGPSTDVGGANPEEATLSAVDQERIRKRLQEGWNRL